MIGTVKRDLGEIRDSLKTLVSLTSLHERQVAVLLLLTLAATALEGFGLVMFVPVVEFLEKGRDVGKLVAGSSYWRHLVAAMDALGLPVALSTLLGAVFVLVIIRQVFVYVQNTYRSRLTATTLTSLQAEGFARLVRADSTFFSRHSVGEIMNVLSLDGIRSGTILFFLSSIATSSLLFLFYTGVLFFMSATMTVLAAGIMAVVGLLAKSRMDASRRYGEEISRCNEDLTEAVVERLSGIETIKMAAAEEREIRFFKRLTDTLFDSSYRLQKSGARIGLLVDPVVIVAVLTIFYMGVELFHFSVAFLGLFLFAMLRLLPFTKTILQSYQRFVGALGSLKTVQGLLEEAEEHRFRDEGEMEFRGLKQEVRFEDVGFSYDGQPEETLADIDLVLPAGTMTVIVGHSGAGKSTLVKLLPRLLESDRGKILFDGTPIESFRIESLRKSIALVSQDEFLFDAPLADNIRYDRLEVTDEEMEEAVNSAYVKEFVSTIHDGYAARVGERGSRLSGGEKKRVAIARALAKKAPIIILDEPTAGLDPASEGFVQKTIQDIRARRNATLVVIAHQPTTIKSADQVAVMEKGRIIWVGSPEAYESLNWLRADA